MRPKFTLQRVAALAAVAGIGIAACSPSGAATKQAAGHAPIDMAGMNMAPPSSAAGATTVPPPTVVPSGAQGKVSITNFAFKPTAMTVKAGTTVKWTNDDVVAHTVTFKDVADSPVLNHGDSFSRTFTKAGTYSYICSIHPFMHATVTVTP